MLVMYTAAVTALKSMPIIQSHSILYGSGFASSKTVFDCVFVHSAITFLLETSFVLLLEDNLYLGLVNFLDI